MNKTTKIQQRKPMTNQAINYAIVADNQTKEGLNNVKNSSTNGQSGNGSKNGKDGKSCYSDKNVNTFVYHVGN